MLTRYKAVSLTREIWRQKSIGVYTHPDIDTSEFLNKCPCCQYVHEQNGNKFFEAEECEKYCPLEWPKNDEGRNTCREGGLYDKYLSADIKTERKIANQISELPEKPIKQEKETISRAEAIRLTREIWRQKSKGVYTHPDIDTSKFLNNCPCCQYVYEQYGSEFFEAEECEKDCPLEWPKNDEGRNDCCKGGLYSKYKSADIKIDLISARKIAKQISELPEKSIKHEKETISRAEAIRLTREIWRWKSESELPVPDIDTSEFLNKCPCCQYVYEQNGSEFFDIKECEKYCPLEWPKNDEGCKSCSNGGLYDKYEASNDPTVKSEIAKQISELPKKPLNKGEQKIISCMDSELEVYIRGQKIISCMISELELNKKMVDKISSTVIENWTCIKIEDKISTKIDQLKKELEELKKIK